MTTWLDVFSDCQAIMGRGSSLDLRYPIWWKKTLSYIERAISFDYMFHISQVELTPIATHPRTISLQAYSIKSIEYVHILSTPQYYGLDEIYSDSVLSRTGRLKLKKVLPGSFSEENRSTPTEYHLSQRNQFVLNSTPADGMIAEIGTYEYSSSFVEDETSHVLFEEFFDGVVSGICYFGALETRDDDTATRHGKVFMDAVRSLKQAHADKNYGSLDISFGGAE